MKNWDQFITDVKNRCFIFVTDVSDLTVKNWNRTQNAVNSGVFYQWADFVSIVTSQSTIFQLCRDGSSWVEPVLSKDKYVLLKDTRH